MAKDKTGIQRLIRPALLVAIGLSCLPFVMAQQAAVRFLGLNEGLSSRAVNAVLQDRRGMMWIGTDNGLSTFNGTRFQLFTGTPGGALKLPSPTVLGIGEDEEHFLWIATSRGAVALNPARNALLPLSELGVPDSLSLHPNFRVEPHPQGGFWMVAGAFLYRYQKISGGYHIEKLGRQPFSRDTPLQMMQSANGQLWLHSLDTGLAIWEGNSFKGPFRISFKKNPQFILPLYITNVLGDSITIFSFDQRKIYRIAEAGNTLQILPNLNLDHTLAPWQRALRYLDDHPELLGKAKLNLFHIYKDRRGAWWFVTNLGIFFVYEAQDYAFRQLDFLEGQSIRGILEDKQGGLWVGTYNGLYYRPLGQNPVVLPEKGPVWSIRQTAENTFWIGKEAPEGLARYLRKSDGSFEIKELPYPVVYDMTILNSSIWAGGEAPVLYGIDMHTQALIQEIQLVPSSMRRTPFVKKILAARNADLWAGGDAGLFWLKPDGPGRYRQDTASLPQRLRDLQVNDLYEDRHGYLWIASKIQGLIRFNPKTKEMREYGEADGLAHHIVYSIVSSHSDSLLWIGSQRGLSCLQTHTGNFTNFYEENGLAHNEFNVAAAFHADDGIIYVGGLNGITYFSPEMPLLAQNAIQAYLLVESLNTKTNNKRQIIPMHTDTLVFQPWEQYLELQLFSNEVFKSDQVGFRFLIPGTADAWKSAGAGEKIILSNLAPGYHQLAIQARSPYGAWGPPFNLYLRVLPPWYRTWWFFALSALLVFAAAYSLFRLRIAQIKREYYLRKQVSDDLHDELGSRLFALRNMAQKMAPAPNGNQEMLRLSEQFNALSRDTLGAIRNFIWAFDPKNDRLEDLITRMEDFADMAIRPLTPVLEFRAQPMQGEKKIKPLVKHHTLQAFQEILTNMSKHTLPLEIFVTVSVTNHTLNVSMRNTYKPKPEAPQEIPGGSGKQSLAARLRAVKGSLAWSDGNDVQEAKLAIPL